MQYTVFVVEKKSSLRMLAAHLAKWPSAVYVITTQYIGLYEFRYPRGLTMADFPFVSPPSWKKRFQELSPVFEVKQGGEICPCNLEADSLLRGASSIVFATDPDTSGAVAFHVLLSESLGDAAAWENRPALCLLGVDESSVVKAFDSIGSTNDDWFQSLRNTGIARRFFDFNYNVNSLALFGQVLRKAGYSGNDYLMSKYSLQLLYALQNQPTALSLGTLMLMMQNWKGTGRYPTSSLGSAASRVAILEGLRRVGLVDEQELKLSVAGQAFLKYLHPDCCDPDLPARIEDWGRAWPSSCPAIERYIKTFFGKQKRFASRP